MNQIIKDLEHIENRVSGWKAEIDGGLALSKEINQELDKFNTDIDKFKAQNNLTTSATEPADGVDVEKLQNELKELKEAVDKYDEIIKRIKKNVNDIGDKPKEWHEETKATKSKVAEYTKNALAIMGGLALAYLVFQGTKKFFFKRK